MTPGFSFDHSPSNASGYYPSSSNNEDGDYLNGLSGAKLTDEGWDILKGDNGKLNNGDQITGPNLSDYVEIDDVCWNSYQTKYNNITGKLIPCSIKIQSAGTNEEGAMLNDQKVDIHVDCYVDAATNWLPVKTYVLNPTILVPEDGADKGASNYYPGTEDGNPNYHTGLVGAQLTSKGWEALLKASGNSKDLEIGDQLVGDLSEYVKIDDVKKDGYKEAFGVTGDIVPYVIKVQSEQIQNGAALIGSKPADIHVDCYVDMEVTMTYYPGFGENPESKYKVKVQTGTAYTVLNYDKTGLPPRSGYTFLGWATESGGKVNHEAGKSIPTVIGAMNFYAVWQEDEDSSGGGDDDDDDDRDPPYVPKPRPDPDPDPDPDPEEIPEYPTPETSGPGGEVVPEGPGGEDVTEIEDDEVPQASLPTVEIDDDETPVTAPPKTGVKTAGSVALLAGSLAVALATLKKRHSK